MDYNLDINLKKYNIEKYYYRDNKECIFDIIREMLVVKTPEEIVRQKFVRYLIEELKVPKSKIELEVPMSHFKKHAKGRADIVVYGENNQGFNIPIIVVECKAPNISLTDDVWFQVYKYDEILETSLIIITNGDFTYGATWDEDYKEYYFVEELPKYKYILSKENFKYIQDDSEGWKRPNFNEITDKENIDKFLEFGWLEEGTKIDLIPLIMNLGGFIFDTEVRCSPSKIDKINIIEDGHRFTSFGNAGGGWWTGDFRYFILECKKSTNQIISISILGSYLVVAIDDFDKRHNSLQLNLNKYAKKDGDKYIIWHDGTLTVGRSGAAKRKEVIEYIKMKEPSLVSDGKNIILGTFECDREINWDQDITRNFIKKLIIYGLLRDEFRRIKQNQRLVY